jgi:hypothetical protein
LKKMGQKSEAFCRQALTVLEQNPQMVPANVPLADAIADLNALEQLRPRMVRLSRLSERASDTDTALGRRDDGGVAGLQPVEADRPYRRPRSAAEGTGCAVCQELAAGGAAGAYAGTCAQPEPQPEAKAA